MDDDPLETAWRTLLDAHWDDEAQHKRFVALAATLARLPDAAARYREIATDPARRDRAEQGKQLVVTHAMTMLDSLPRASRDVGRERARLIVPLVTLGVMLSADFVLAGLTHQQAFVSIPAFILEILVVLLLPWRRLLP